MDACAAPLSSRNTKSRSRYMKEGLIFFKKKPAHRFFSSNLLLQTTGMSVNIVDKLLHDFRELGIPSGLQSLAPVNKGSKTSLRSLWDLSEGIPGSRA